MGDLSRSSAFTQGCCEVQCLCLPCPQSAVMTGRMTGRGQAMSLISCIQGRTITGNYCAQNWVLQACCLLTTTHSFTTVTLGNSWHHQSLVFSSLMCEVKERRGMQHLAQRLERNDCLKRCPLLCLSPLLLLSLALSSLQLFCPT